MIYEKENKYTGTRHTRLQLNRIFICILFTFFIHTSAAANAYAAGQTTFKWQANPSQENVIGYRLYYGSQSRVDSNGKLKSNFTYDYYIDLAKSVRCNNLSYANDCEYLPSNELSCVGLDSNSPQCTLSNLQGTLHLALTAYNSATESNYTSEIKIAPGSLPPNSRNSKLNPAIQMLLLSKNSAS